MAKGAPSALSALNTPGRQVGLHPYLIRNKASTATCRTKRFHDHLMEPRFDKLETDTV